MKQARLGGLLVIMAALVALRASDPWRADAPQPIAEAVDRAKPLQPSHAADSTPRPNKPAPTQRELDDAEPRNAFAVRLPPAPPPPPKPVAVPPPKPFVGPMPAPPPPPPPPPPAPPPFQVIGTWEDAQGISAFVAGPRSTLQARAGDVLLGEFRVVRVSRQELVVRGLAATEDIRLPVPASNSALASRP